MKNVAINAWLYFLINFFLEFLNITFKSLIYHMPVVLIYLLESQFSSINLPQSFKYLLIS